MPFVTGFNTGRSTGGWPYGSNQKKRLVNPPMKPQQAPAWAPSFATGWPADANAWQNTASSAFGPRSFSGEFAGQPNSQIPSQRAKFLGQGPQGYGFLRRPQAPGSMEQSPPIPFDQPEGQATRAPAWVQPQLRGLRIKLAPNVPEPNYPRANVNLPAYNPGPPLDYLQWKMNQGMVSPDAFSGDGAPSATLSPPMQRAMDSWDQEQAKNRAIMAAANKPAAWEPQTRVGQSPQGGYSASDAAFYQGRPPSGIPLTERERFNRGNVKTPWQPMPGAAGLRAEPSTAVTTADNVTELAEQARRRLAERGESWSLARANAKGATYDDWVAAKRAETAGGPAVAPWVGPTGRPQAQRRVQSRQPTYQPMDVRQRMVTAKAQGRPMTPEQASMAGMIQRGEELKPSQILAMGGPEAYASYAAWTPEGIQGRIMQEFASGLGQATGAAALKSDTAPQWLEQFMRRGFGGGATGTSPFDDVQQRLASLPETVRTDLTQWLLASRGNQADKLEARRRLTGIMPEAELSQFLDRWYYPGAGTVHPAPSRSQLRPGAGGSIPPTVFGGF